MALLEGSPTAILSPAALAAALSVHERTLQRAVRETWGATTKEYLLLRALHAARRRLRRPPEGAEGVTGILAALGIWEFGRFAGRYRSHFGELPSQTLAAARGATVSCRGPAVR
jgi:AraC family transcriptional regulator, ethanolamine operon transcriptional activator